MSAYGHQMEREYSAHSLSSRGSSEIEYTMETGIYMSSFAATIFIAGLVTVGVSLMTLLIALTIMLQSCQSKNSGFIELQQAADYHDYCKIFTLHLELNHLDSDSLPAVCQKYTAQYISAGHYMRELNITLQLIENYISSTMPSADGGNVVLMDADDLFVSDALYIDQLQKRFNHYSCSNCKKVAKYHNQMPLHGLFMKLRDGGWPLVLLSRKLDRQRDAVVKHLLSVGCGDWASLIMRMDDEMEMNNREYISSRRSIIQKQGLKIVAAISSQLDILTSFADESQNFKLPNLVYSHKMNHEIEKSSLEYD